MREWLPFVVALGLAPAWATYLKKRRSGAPHGSARSPTPTVARRLPLSLASEGPDMPAVRTALMPAAGAQRAADRRGRTDTVQSLR
jgi:hypothetical protein